MRGRHSMGVTARRGLRRGARTRTFTLRDLEAALGDLALALGTAATTTVYVETDVEGYVVGARGESAARVALCARAAPPPRAVARAVLVSPAALCLELTAGVPPHHDLTVWPPLQYLLLQPATAASDPRPATSDPRPAGGHECGYCGRRYSRRYGLRIHERTHTGARPLRCPHCARPFADPSNLNKHVRLHQRDGYPPPRRRRRDRPAVK